MAHTTISSKYKALAAFYQGLAGRLNIASLTDHVIVSLKKLTGAARVELDLAPSLADSIYSFENGAAEGFRDLPPGRAGSRPAGRRLDFELSVKDQKFGEMRLYFDGEDEMEAEDPSIMLEIAQTVANALQAVDKHQKAVNLAARDGLTGLYNRRIFNEVLKREFAKAKRHGHSLSLLSIDLDHFKAVNDNFGHQTGDLVLKSVARVIAQVARGADLAARVGGEEFAVILPHTSEEQASFLAGRLKTILEETGFELNGAVFHQTVSQGIVDSEHFMVNSPEDMVYCADRALYTAKREGRDTVRLASDLSITPVTKDGAYAFQ